LQPRFAVRRHKPQNIFHSSKRAVKGTELNIALRTYAQLIGPNCDDAELRQRAAQQAIEAAHHFEPEEDDGVDGGCFV
jgi:hypothetical protein